MPWLRLVMDLHGRDAARIEQALLASGAVAISLEDAADSPVLEPAPGATPLWPHTRLTALYEAKTDLERVKSALRRDLQLDRLPTHSEEILADRVWEIASGRMNGAGTRNRCTSGSACGCAPRTGDSPAKRPST